ncbi:hypothetical protein Taro_006012, partial [Colocasia esculenta]|nr:hypothetical protein [Colocasia esculenta]
NISPNHVNLGRGNHTESADHGDWKLCSTRRENSCPDIGIAYVSTIRNRQSERVDRTPISRNSCRGQNSTAERVY